MPIAAFTPGGTSEGKTSTKNSSNINTARDATAGGSIADNTSFAIARKAGSKYHFFRGIFIFDFSTGGNVGIPNVIRNQRIRVFRADLLLSDTSVSAADSGGDKLVVSHIHDPNTFGTWHANDYSDARYSKHTSAQTIANGADDAVFRLDNRLLLREIENAINRRIKIHLATRNYLDSSGGTPTGMNKIMFDDVDDDDPLIMKIYFKSYDASKFAGNRGGFSGGNIKTFSGGGFSEI